MYLEPATFSDFYFFPLSLLSSAVREFKRVKTTAPWTTINYVETEDTVTRDTVTDNHPQYLCCGQIILEFLITLNNSYLSRRIIIFFRGRKKRGEKKNEEEKNCFAPMDPR